MHLVRLYGRSLPNSFLKCHAPNLQTISLLNEYLAGVTASESWMTQRPNRVWMTRLENISTGTMRAFT